MDTALPVTAEGGDHRCTPLTWMIGVGFAVIASSTTLFALLSRSWAASAPAPLAAHLWFREPPGGRR